jgi:ribosomal protein S25
METEQLQFTEEQYKAAVEKVKKYQQVSVSMIQRMGLKYTPAAMIIDRMEQEGIIAGYNGKPRRVLIK